MKKKVLSQQPFDAPSTVDGGTPTGQLSGWKEIGAYLGVDVRTAQRYEEELHLPVHRLESGARGRVYALIEELEAWKRAKSQSPPWWRTVPGLQRVAGALACVSLALAAALLWALRPVQARATEFVYQGNHFVALSASGLALWRHPLPKPPDNSYGRQSPKPPILLTDLDGDGQEEVVLWYRSLVYLTPDILMCFSATSGELLWQFTPDRKLRDSSHRFSANYHIRDIETLRSPADASRRWVVVVTVAAFGHPSIVSLLDEHGNLLRDYVHSGHLEDLLVTDMNQDGSDEIVAGGHNVAHDRATIVVLDPSTLGGASREPAGSKTQIEGLPSPSGELARLFFPRTPVSLLARTPHSARELYPDGERFVAQVFEMRPNSHDWAFLTYVVEPDFSISKVRADEFMMTAWDKARAEDPSIPALDESELQRLAREVAVITSGAPSAAPPAHAAAAGAPSP